MCAKCVGALVNQNFLWGPEGAITLALESGYWHTMNTRADETSDVQGNIW